MVFSILPLTTADIEAASALIHNCFGAFIAQGFEKDWQVWQEVGSPEAIAQLVAEDLIIGAFDASRLVGVTAMQGTRHLRLFFVDQAYHRQGIGRAMWCDMERLCLEQDPSEAPFTLNSTDYAVPVYLRLGFTITGKRMSKNGLSFTPMERPARMETAGAS